MVDQGNNTNSNHYDELDPELQSVMVSTSISNGNNTVHGNSTSNNETDYSHSPSHQNDHPLTPTPSLVQITSTVRGIYTNLGRRSEEDLNRQLVRRQVLVRLRRMRADYEELADFFGELSYAAGEPQPEGSQSAVTTTTTATTSSTTVSGDTTADGNSINNSYTSLNTAADAYIKTLAAVVSSLPSLGVSTPVTTQQQQPHAQGFSMTTILGLISSIRRQICRLRNGFRALERYLGEDITQANSLQTAEMLRQAYATFVDIASMALRELNEMEMTTRREL